MTMAKKEAQPLQRFLKNREEKSNRLLARQVMSTIIQMKNNLTII